MILKYYLVFQFQKAANMPFFFLFIKQYVDKLI